MDGELIDLYERYDQPIGKFILSFLRQNSCIAPLTHFEGIKSSIFLKVGIYLEINTLEDPEHFLYKSSKNACLSHIRRPPCSKSKSSHRIVSLDDLPNNDFLISPYRSIHERLELKEFIIILRQEISSLPTKYKEACFDFCMELTHNEIGIKRNISTDTSRKNRQTAFHLLRQKLEKRGIEINPSKKGGKD